MCCNLKFQPAAWATMEMIRIRCGYKSVYELLTAVVLAFIKNVARLRGELPDEELAPQDISNEIEEMFAGLYDYEPTPFNTPRPVRHNNRHQDETSPAGHHHGGDDGSHLNQGGRQADDEDGNEYESGDDMTADIDEGPDT